ncbi:MAG: 5'-3' exonuclease [Patescibacteria group bacterium]
MKTLLLIDAHSLIHRSFHALPPLTTPEGKPIQAIYGLGSIFLKLWREDCPEYAAACFDRPEPTFRKERYEAYKAQRPRAPDELVAQIIEARNFFDAFGIKTFEKAGYEADDLIATLAEKFRKENNLQVVILTGDLDTLQLVKDGEVAVRTFKKGISETIVYDEQAVRDRYGLTPAQLADYKALVGDASDNVKGVLGVGPKTAAELLKKYGTLERVYQSIGNEPKFKTKLEGTEAEAEFSKSLVLLERHVPIKIGLLEDLDDRIVIDPVDIGLAALSNRLGGGKPDLLAVQIDFAHRLAFRITMNVVSSLSFP